jgi:hypothetical protein
MNIYTDNGFKDRKSYLSSLAEDYGVSIQNIIEIAELLGSSEDFDGLISILNDMEDYN